MIGIPANFATASSDSRSLAFASQIRRATNGRGVDVVINALAGEAIPLGISVLAPRGRFIEIGKRDLYGDSALGMRGFVWPTRISH